MKQAAFFPILFFILCSCIGPVQKHLEAEKEDCIIKNPGKEDVCHKFFHKATLLYTREPKFDEKSMSMQEYNKLFKRSLADLRKTMGLK